MRGLAIHRAKAVLARRGQVVGYLSDVAGFLEPAGDGCSRIELRGIHSGRPSYWLAEGMELEVTWSLGPERRAGRIGATLEVLRYDVETGQVTLRGLSGLQVNGPWTGPLAAE